MFAASATGQDITPDALRALQQHTGQQPDDNPTIRPTIQTYQPTVPSRVNAPPSHLETIYSLRVGRALTQFGYDFLGVPSAVSISQSGAVQGGYVLAQGDELSFVLRGQENSSYRERINRDGQIILPKLEPIQAAGRTLDEVRSAVEAQVARAFVSTKVFVTVGDVHQLSVLVTGEVRTPGMRIVSALASPLDAILLSGGIGKTGSLRNIQLIRGGVVRLIDLYSVIAQGRGANLGGLRDGDRIYVPPLGATVAVAGSVRRQGIYELPGSTQSVGVASLIRIAGGLEIAGSYNLSKTLLARDGTTNLVPVTLNDLVSNGEVLSVDPNHVSIHGRVSLVGAVEIPGERPLSVAATIGDLIRDSNDLARDAYTPFAVIVRRDLVSNIISIVPFSLVGALKGGVKIRLQSSDQVFVFTHAEIHAIASLGASSNDSNSTIPVPSGAPAPSDSSTPANDQSSPDQPRSNQPLPGQSPADFSNGQTPDVRRDLNGQVPDSRGDSNGQGAVTAGGAALADALRINRAQRGEDVVPARQNENSRQTLNRIAYALDVSREALLRTVTDNLVWVFDEVRVPGAYAAANGTTVNEMIQVAGGAMQVADLSAIEVTSTEFDQRTGASRTSRQTYSVAEPQMATVLVRPFDVIRLQRVYADREVGETVTISGEVRYPGAFDIRRDEHLSEVLQRAGGLTETAYPYGAIFTRKDAALSEREGNAREAREVESQIASLALSPSAQAQGQGPSNISYLSNIVEELRRTPALGRVTITADPVVLSTRPELDIVLRSGDTLFIPKRPSSITISGEVRNPGAFQYGSGKSFDEYLRLAGGPTQSADVGSSFIVMPDGTAQPVEHNWLSFDNGRNIPPGATVVVPRDLRPFEWNQFVKDFAQIFSQLAVAAASLSVLRSN